MEKELKDHMKLMNTTNSHATLVQSQLESTDLPLLRSIQLVTDVGTKSSYITIAD